MIGSIQVISRHPVDETVIFNGFTAAAGMGAIRSLSKFRIPILSDTSRGVRTGIALSNPTPTRVDVTLRLRDEDGEVVDGAKVTVSLAGNGQIVQFTEEFFDGGIDFSQFSGTVEVSSSVPINGMAIRVSPGKFATLRATPIP
ncbi:hypothetical protein MYX84_13685 [Acidobacteria bacterium AH-259-O06]|nr:hypothetical protein [Acidobacteria bacterium AH-259-O06]